MPLLSAVLRPKSLLALALALALGLLLPLSAQAQPATPESAQSIQQQLQSWLAALLGPAVNPAALVPQVMPEGDHYRLNMPIPGLVNGGGATAALQPLDNGRWQLNGIQVPPSMHFNLNLPETPDQKAGSPTEVDLHIGAQDSHAVIDPALHSRSEVAVSLRDVKLRSDGPHQQQEQAIARYDATATLVPNGSGRMDFDQTASIVGLSSAGREGADVIVGFGADRMTASGRISGLDPARAGVLLSAVTGLIATLPAKAVASGDTMELTPAERTALRQVIESVRGVFDSAQGEDTIEGLHFAVGGLGEAAIKRLHFALGGDAPQGILQGWFDIAVDGIAIPDLPPEAQALMPKHLVLHPAVRGIPMQPLLQLALDATQPGADEARLQAEAEALLAHGATIALETLGFDLGPANVRGTGQIVVKGLDDYRGEAHLTATGVDALIDKARSDPLLQQAMPVLIMLRGLAKPEGDHLVWNIVALGDAVTVNGIPLSGQPSSPPGHPPRR